MADIGTGRTEKGFQGIVALNLRIDRFRLRVEVFGDHATCCLEIRIWLAQSSWHSHLM